MRALCPVLLHLLQTRPRFVGGGLGLSVEEEAAADDGVTRDDAVEQVGTGRDGTAEDDERGVSGCGQT